MNFVVINGEEYQVPKMDFDAICDLEERGVNLLGMSSNNPKLATTVRGLVAWIMGVDAKTASAEIEEHLKNGGNLVDIFTAISDAMENAGFLSQQKKKKPKKYPQDHQRGNQQKNNQQRDMNASPIS